MILCKRLLRCISSSYVRRVTKPNFVQTATKSTEQKQKMIFQVVSEDDLEKVLSVRDPTELYGGYDYLKDRYNMLISDKRNRGYLFMKQERPIAFMFNLLIDDDKTGVFFALRIAKDFEENDTLVKLSKCILDMEARGRMEQIRFSLDEERYHIVSKGRIIKNLDYVAKRLILPYKLTKEKAKEQKKSIFSSCTSKSTEKLNSTQFIQVLTSNDLCKILFPDRKIYKLCIAYSSVVENIPLIFDPRTIVVGSSLSDVKQAMLSIGTYSFTSKGMLYHLEVFGNTEKYLHDHICAHLKSCVDHSDLDITLEIIADERNELHASDHIMSKYGLDKINGYGNRAIYYFDIPKSSFIRRLRF